MSIYEYLDPYDQYSDPEDIEVQCRRCGKRGLHWSSDGDRWVLTEGHGETHKCKSAALAKRVADDFDVIE